MNFIFEAISIGIMLLFLGLIIFTITQHSIYKRFPSLKEYAVMSLVLFISGFLFHIIAEFSGMNKWYCKHGSACK